MFNGCDKNKLAFIQMVQLKVFLRDKNQLTGICTDIALGFKETPEKNTASAQG